MRIKKVMVAGAASVVGAALVALTQQPAFAVTGVDARPEKVIVDQSYENVPVRLGGVALNESCSITMENYATRAYVDSDYLMDGATTTTLKVYDWQLKPGKHRVKAECTDYDTFTDTAAYDDIVIKFRGYITNKAARAGSYVTLSGRASRYSATSLSYRAPVPGKSLIVQKKVAGVWKSIKYPTTTSTGSYSIRIYSPYAAYWRVLLPETTNAWSAAGAPVYR